MAEHDSEGTSKISGWHIERRINLGDFIGLGTLLLVALVPLTQWGAAVEKRIAVNSTAIHQTSLRADAQDERINRLEDRTNQQLQHINDKLDKLLQQGVGR